MEAADVKKPWAVEAENAQLKKLLAESMMEVSTRKKVLGETSEAWFKTEISGLGHYGRKLPTEARLCAHGC